MFKVEFSNISKKFLKKCNNSLYERIVSKIKKLSEEPFPSDAVRIVNRQENKEKNLIFISEINKRSKIY